MVLATADFVALPLPVGCDVPVGALNHTGVMSKRNELLLRSRATGPRTLRYFLLTYPEVAATAGVCNLLTYPASYHRTSLLKLKKYETLCLALPARNR